MTQLPATWSASILRFWFEEIAPEQWFKKDDAFDSLVRGQFLALHESCGGAAGRGVRRRRR